MAAKKRALIVLLGCLIFWGWSFAHTAEFRVRTQRAVSPPRIDGVLEESVWKNAPAVTDFIQFEPHKGAPASVKTITAVLYDDNYIYFGFTCLDPEVGKLELGTGRRDNLEMGTDSVMVLIDTFYDRRTAYYFRTNLSGVQHDGRVSDNGRTADVTWDGIWKSAGARTEWGWSAEMAIPLTTLKFKRGNDQTWGFQTGRYYPRNFEKSFWAGPLEDYRKISDIGILTGLELEESGKRLQVIPHVLSRIEEKEKAEVEAGLMRAMIFHPLFRDI
jgi:hypothetical protein